MTGPQVPWTSRPPRGRGEGRGGRRRAGRLRVAAVLLLAIGLVLGIAVAAVARDLHDYRASWEGRILPGAVVNGVDLAGMTRDEAIAAVEATLAPELDRQVTLRGPGRTWTVTLRDLGASTDASAAVDEAMAAGSGVSWRTLAEIRWRQGAVPHTGQASVQLPVPAVREFVRQVAQELHVAPIDGALSWDRQRVTFHPAREGRGVAIAATVDRLVAALQGGSATVDVELVALQPQQTLEAFSQVLFLRQADHQLDLYLDGRVARTYVVATGTGEYPTPTGVYEVSLKRREPVWVNPDPTGWGRDMPRRIGPGPNNPLGLRALNWSAPGAIRFHGTAAIDSLGRDASHGCVRLSNTDIVELFELVDVGATIISVD